MVVPLYIRIDVRIRCRRDRVERNRDAGVGFLSGLAHQFLLYDSDRDHSGHYESADRLECDYRVDHWVRVAREAAGDDVVQDLGLCRTSLFFLPVPGSVF